MPIHDWSRGDAGILHDVHLGWIDGLRAVLNRELLPDPFYALAEPVLGGIVPDVLTLRSPSPIPEPAIVPRLLDDEAERPVTAATLVMQDLPSAEVYGALARHIVVKDSLRDDAVVAVVEIVSRANKTSRDDRDRMVWKTVGLLRSKIHVVLVDVQPPTSPVPRGFHDLICEAHGEVPAPLPESHPLQTVSYQVLEDGTRRSHVVPLRMGDRLPDMPVFLTSHRYVRIPLEETYMTAFDNLPRKFREVLAGRPEGGGVRTS